MSTQAAPSVFRSATRPGRTWSSTTPPRRHTNYTLNATSVSTGTTPAMTTSGLRLTFRLTDANSFIMTIDRLCKRLGVDNTLTADLLANADQTITNLRIFTLNTGNGTSRDRISTVSVSLPFQRLRASHSDAWSAAWSG